MNNTSSYQTGARKAIIEFLKDNSEKHFSVEEITDGIGGVAEKHSRSTVYRQISKLCGEGLLKRFEKGGANSFYYQYAGFKDECELHFHLKCAECGKLIHMECDEMQKVKEHILQSHSFLIGGEEIINGICKNCMRTEADND